ncbi:DUF3846 domain-containing protein [Nocardia farcinica]|uniref:DUF3846 domain-containing protein n=1 Tax=Nocardia farcinica TaxID=37329 RepID=UPI00226BCC04|nr:DUF3846 domain-containing protein [Nocardia farcinica]
MHLPPHLPEHSFSLVIPPDGDMYPINLDPARALEQMYDHLDCRYVDVVRLTDRLDMWLDDEGMLRHWVNVPATSLAHLYGFTHQLYFGPVLLCSADPDGNSIDLPAEIVGALRDRLRNATQQPYGNPNHT